MAFPNGVKPPASISGAVKFMASVQSETIFTSSLPKAFIINSWTRELASISSFNSFSSAISPAFSCFIGSPRIEPEQSKTKTQGVLSLALSANSTYGIVFVVFFSTISASIHLGSYADIHCLQSVTEPNIFRKRSKHKNS